VGDDKEAAVLAAHGVHAAGDDLESVDIETGIGFVENGVFWLQHHELEDLVALLFAAGEAFIDTAAGEAAVHLELVHAGVKLLVKFHGVNVLALGQAGLQRGAEEVGVADAGDLMRVLEGKEQAGATAGIDGHVEDVFAIEEDFATGDFVVFVATEDFAQRTFARAIRAHDGMDFTGVDGEVQAFEDFAAGDLSVEGFNFEGHEGGEMMMIEWRRRRRYRGWRGQCG